LRGQIALVTGASGDIGRAIAEALSAGAVNVIAVGRRRERLAAITEGPGHVHPLAADLTRDEARASVEEAVARTERLDLLVLASGIYDRAQDPARLADLLTANVTAPYALLQAVLPWLERAQGYVVFINSTQGLAASPGVGQFAATQHAMRAIADSLREEVNARGIRVASVFLGRTASERQAAIFAMEGRPYTPKRLIQPADVARIVLALLALPANVEVTDITLRPRLKP
jgi:NADP-dependent 3-hydroxy acid dehydrogenase YdfG